MKYSGSDFKFTSQANHLQKLLTLKTENHRENIHAQRLYKRRKTHEDGHIMSNWHILNQSAIGEQNQNTSSSSTTTNGSGWNTVVIIPDDDSNLWEEIKPKKEY